MKKLLSILIVTVLFAACLIPTAFAESTVAVSVSSKEAKPGDTVTLSVSVKGNQIGFYSYGFVVNYDKDALEFIGVSAGDLSAPSANPATNKIGFYAQNAVLGDGVLFNMNFKVKDTASEGTYAVNLAVDDFTDAEWDSTTVNLSGGTITVNVPHVHEGVLVDEVPAGCGTTGVKAHYKCSCGGLFLDKDCTNEVAEDDLTIPALTHDYVGKVTKDPSCCEDGEMTYTCSICKNSYTEVIKATGNHDYGKPELVEGNTEQHVLRCTTPGCPEKKYESHDWKLADSKEPNCKNDGYEDYKCECGATKRVVLESTGDHNYQDWEDNKDGKTHTGTCDCGEQKTEDHTWDKVEVTKQPTCKEEGVKTFTCKCGATKTEPIAKTTTHSFGKWVENKETGKHERTCSVCGKVEEADHKWNSGMVTQQPTCSDKGVKTFTCKDCHATKTQEIPATGEHDYTDHYVESEDGKSHEAYCACGAYIVEEHDYTQEGDVLKKPTTTEEGKQEMLCVCGAKTTVTLKKLPADYDDVPKTGDITGQIILFTVSAAAVIAGAAYLVIKRKFVK